jgi:lysozyme
MSVNNLTYDSDGLKLTESFEGCRLVAYQDVKGVWTIGYGHTGVEVFPGMTITQAQAETFLASDIIWASNFVNRNVTVKINQQTFDSLVDFTFNVGVGNFLHSTLLRLINAGVPAQAALQFASWCKSGGQYIAGLARRRQAEEDMFERGVKALPPPVLPETQGKDQS